MRTAASTASRPSASPRTPRISGPAAPVALAPGIVRRLWDARDRLRPHREPEIHRIDLASTALDVIAWGGDPRTLEWFDRPYDQAIEAALTLLRRLTLIEAGTPGETRFGLRRQANSVRRLPLHPRLGRMLVAAGGARSDRAGVRAAVGASPAAGRARRRRRRICYRRSTTGAVVPPHVQRVARTNRSVTSDFELRTSSFRQGDFREADFRLAVLAGYPDRVAQRREAGSPSVLPGVRHRRDGSAGKRRSRWRVPRGARRQRAFPSSRPGTRLSAGRSRLAFASPASSIATGSTRHHQRLCIASTARPVGYGRCAVDRYDALVLAEHHVTPDPELAAQLLADAWIESGPGKDDGRVLRRLRFAGRDVDLVSVLADGSIRRRRISTT